MLAIGRCNQQHCSISPSLISCRPQTPAPPAAGCRGNLGSWSGARATLAVHNKQRRAMHGVPVTSQRSAQQALMQEERVTFSNAQGEKLVGSLLPAATQKAVCLCHGYTDHRNGFHLPQLAQQLAARGIASLRFDFSGNGESQGSFHYGNYRHEAEDIRAAVQFLQSRGMEVTAILGHSKGGDAVITYSAKYDDIPKVVNVSGRFWCNTGIQERFGQAVVERVKAEGQVEMPGGPHGKGWSLTQEDINERLSTDMEANCAAVQRSTVLTIHGSEDAVISHTNGAEFARRLPGHLLHVVQGADHNFTRPEHANELIQTTVDFVSGS